VAALTTWPALTPPSLVAPKRTEPEGRTWTGSAHRISRASNSDATKFSNTAPGRLHSASPVTVSFDEVLRSEGIRVIKTPVRSPRANAYAERWVRTVRTECLDSMLVLSRGHLERVLRENVNHYDRQRPHRGIDLQVPVLGNCTVATPQLLDIDRHDVLGGLIHEYHPVAAA